MPNVRTCSVNVPGHHPFRIVLGEEEVTGHTSYGVDPISRDLAKGKYVADRLVLLMLELTQPGQVVLDVGAHIGLFTLAAANAGRRVVAVEAAARNCELLRASIAANQFETRVRLEHAVASRAPGTLSFIERGPFGMVTSPQTEGCSRVNAMRVSDLLTGDPGPFGLLKIDIEGHEIEALEGMADWLAQIGPPILYEANQYLANLLGQTTHELHESLFRLGYTHQYLIREPGLLTPVQIRDPQPVVVGDYLATRTPLSPLPGWMITEPLKPSGYVEIATPELDSCWDSGPFLECMGRGFRESRSSLLRDPVFGTLIERLASHPNAQVRASVAWHRSLRWKLSGISLRTRNLMGRIARRLKRLAG